MLYTKIFEECDFSNQGPIYKLPVSKVDLEFVYILDLCYVNYYKDDLFNALFEGKLI